LYQIKGKRNNLNYSFFSICSQNANTGGFVAYFLILKKFKKKQSTFSNPESLNEKGKVNFSNKQRIEKGCFRLCGKV